mmetsp:Transcript_6637/g.16523  ORF Transcript_6637/g.16523 Transcript_6637/m.16523 type:complete len:211 (+) Transcript_6637:549-1181(+)
MRWTAVACRWRGASPAGSASMMCTTLMRCTRTGWTWDGPSSTTFQPATRPRAATMPPPSLPRRRRAGCSCCRRRQTRRRAAAATCPSRLARASCGHSLGTCATPSRRASRARSGWARPCSPGSAASAGRPTPALAPESPWRATSTCSRARTATRSSATPAMLPPTAQEAMARRAQRTTPRRLRLWLPRPVSLAAAGAWRRATLLSDGARG